MTWLRGVMLPVLAAGVALHGGTAFGWEDYPGFFGPGHAGIVIGDFDGDGRLEAAVSGYTGMTRSQLLSVLGAGVDGTLSIETITALPTALTGSLVLAPREGNADRLAVVATGASGNQILILGGVPLRVLRTIEAPQVHMVAAIADVDADGQLDIVALTGTSEWGDRFPVVLDYETGAVKWMGAHAATDVGVAQLDDDPAMELILAGRPGRVVDGATGAVEWTYPGGFGNKILVGRFGADGRTGFATVERWSGVLQFFQSTPWSPVSDIPVGEVGAATVIVPAGSTGPDLIAIGEGQWGKVKVYNPVSGETLKSFSNPEHGVSAIATGDIGGDGRIKLVFGAGLTSSGTDALRALDLDTMDEVFVQNDEGGPYSAVARGDLQGDGSDQVVYLTVESRSGYRGANLYVLDAVTGKRLRMRENVFESWSRVLPNILLGQPDGSGGQSIIVAGGSGYAGLVAVLDGMTLEDRWRVGGYQSVFEDGPVHSLATIDVNGDGTPDIVTATAAARLVVLDGQDGSVLWQSIPLPGSAGPAIATFEGADGLPYVALVRGEALYVFNLHTRLLAASTYGESTLSGVWHWGTGDDCRLATLDQDSIVALYRCGNLASLGERLMPEETAFFRPLDPHGERFLAASGRHLYQVDADGKSIRISRSMGGALGAGNKGVLRPGAAADQYDLVIGSDYMVTRVRVGLDELFANGFD